MSKKIIIFEPAMCCSTGLCGPSIDPELLRLSTLVNTLSKQGIKIDRYNVSSDPQEFVNNKIINEKLSKDGIDVFPITLLDGVIAKTHEYPTNKEISEWLDIDESIIEAKKKNTSGCCGGSGCC